MTVLINKETEFEKWINLLKKSKYSTPFQSPDYFNFINSVEDFSADVFTIEESDEYKSLIVVTVQKEKGIKSYFSKRGIIYGGPLLISSEGKYLSYLLNEVNRYYRKRLIYLEVRNNHNFNSCLKNYNKSGWTYNRHLNVQLNVENISIERILSKMKYNRRREINLSYKEGAVVRQAIDENEIVSLFEILKDLYITRVKLPLPPFSFFLNIFKSRIGKVFVVLHENKIIGGSICVFHENMTINTLYYAGLRNYHKKIFPTHIAIMGVIKFAINNNLKMVDFMGAGKPDEDYGVRNFKLQFGGDLVEHGRFIKILNPFLYKLGVLGLKLLSKLK